MTAERGTGSECIETPTKTSIRSNCSPHQGSRCEFELCLMAAKLKPLGQTSRNAASCRNLHPLVHSWARSYRHTRSLDFGSAQLFRAHPLCSGASHPSSSWLRSPLPRQPPLPFMRPSLPPPVGLQLLCRVSRRVASCALRPRARVCAWCRPRARPVLSPQLRHR